MQVIVWSSQPTTGIQANNAVIIPKMLGTNEVLLPIEMPNTTRCITKPNAKACQPLDSTMSPPKKGIAKINSYPPAIPLATADVVGFTHPLPFLSVISLL